MKRVFLGGTCNGSNWREHLIQLLTIDYFNPVVEDWTPECQQKEIEERENCDFCIYVITPKMTGVYAIAEVADDLNKRPEKTIFCLLPEDEGEEFNEWQLRSLNQVAAMVASNGVMVATHLQNAAEILNSY